VISASSWRSDPAAALRGLAKVLPPPPPAGVQRVEIGVAHVDLAAHLQHLRRAVDPVGMSAMVRALAVTFSPTAPSPRVAASPVCRPRSAATGDRPSIFGSAVKGSGRSFGKPEVAADAGHEIAHVLIVEGVGERHHPLGMGEFGKPFRRGGADALAGAVGALEVRETAPRARRFPASARRTRHRPAILPVGRDRFGAHRIDPDLPARPAVTPKACLRTTQARARC
jgi:hypothetical protein